MKDYFSNIIITNATTGQNIKIINLDDFEEVTVTLMIRDIFKRYGENGIILHYGIKPY